MSKWRQKGFVQDSDEEEEESQLDSQNGRSLRHLHGRVERVCDGGDAALSEECDTDEWSAVNGKRSLGENGRYAIPEAWPSVQHRDHGSPQRVYTPKRPTASPLTPVRLIPTPVSAESPDPLQSSLTPKSRLNGNVKGTGQLHSQLSQGGAPLPEVHTHNHATDSAIDPQDYPQHPLQGAVVESNGTSNILQGFGIHSLSDSSDDDSLSDPPTDIESPEGIQYTVQPHRRTAVQVVIPSSTALQRHLQVQESRREFRQRKPIQLHPYALEGERYRREVQSRGLKPVPRPRSPDQRVRQRDDIETQEQDFDPNASLSSSPLEQEIPVSTPVIRKARKDPLRGGSEPHRTAHTEKRRISSTQIRRQQNVKRRKLNLLPSDVNDDSNISADPREIHRDIWSNPPNSPPYSSSPALPSIRTAPATRGLIGITPAANLPTPSTSSVLHDDRPLLSESDPEDVLRSAPRSIGALDRQTRTIFSEPSSAASEFSGESEQSEVELRQVGRRIKGVLPASWLRFDRQSQQRRHMLQKERQRIEQQSATSPGPRDPQRGVAKRVLKRGGEGRIASTLRQQSDDTIIISDGSDIEPADLGVSDHVQDWRRTAHEARNEVAAIDARHLQDDSDEMENDRLHLFTFGGTRPKRKKQTRLTDNFVSTKKINGRGNSRKKIPRLSANRVKTGVPRRRHRVTPPPALSVIDVEMTATTMPLFLRVARRQALRRLDLARQSPRHKTLHLQSIEDTGDANDTLRRWQQGSLKPAVNVAPRPMARTPLSDIIDNQQSAPQYSQERAEPIQGISPSSKATLPVAVPRRSTVVPTALQVFKRTSSKHRGRNKQQHDTNQAFSVSARRRQPPFRAAQLEEEEQSLDHSHRRMAFANGLRHVEYQHAPKVSERGPYVNPQLERFLAADDAPSVHSALDSTLEGPISEHKQRRKPNRIRRKVKAQRIDIDTREYRQPSEPAVLESIRVVELAQDQQPESRAEDAFMLQGLGPYGTQYPTTFDITSFPSDTYFHSSTLVGSEVLRHSISVAQPGSRDLDEFAGYHTITHGSTTIRCGPWNDEISSQLQSLMTDFTAPLSGLCSDESTSIYTGALDDIAWFLRELINYVTEHLSFLDSVDRRAFVTKLQKLLSLTVTSLASLTRINEQIRRKIIDVYTRLLILSNQTVLVAQDDVVSVDDRHAILELKMGVAREVVAILLHTGIPEISRFLEDSKRHAVRQNGIQESEVLVNSIVVCMHSMKADHASGHGFWDIVSRELSPKMTNVTHIQDFELTWATIFTLLPFIEFDICGIPLRDMRESFSGDNWGCISVMLRRLFELYPATYKRHGSSTNDYVRSVLARCHRLIKYWHWQQPEQMLNATFDFFGKNGLRPLRREGKDGSLTLLDDLPNEQSLTLDRNESSFHIALKSLALGLRGMRAILTEKKIRSFVFRSIPNHGRNYPKDQSLDAESLAALRNHHDLLCILYWAAPPTCRPKLDLLRGLINHETSHREACRINVRSWANLAAFQVAADEPYTSLQPFATWHKEVMDQTLKQYRLAKIEAEDYLKSLNVSSSTDVATKMVQQAMAKNQEQVIATLRDCITGVRKILHHAKSTSISHSFLEDCGVISLLELPHLEDHRLISVIRDTLILLREVLTTTSQTLEAVAVQENNEESQDYGDFPSLDDLDEDDDQHNHANKPKPSLDLIQQPLWHLLSNAFGAEAMPDDNLLMDCVDSWALFAAHKVSTGEKSWAYFLESFGQHSWQQLRRTEQTQKFSPYFLASLVNHDPQVFREHRTEIVTALLVSLLDRESMLRFQHRFLHAVLRPYSTDPLLVNLPFFRDEENGDWDVNADTVRSRRLALISSILCNIRDDVHRVAAEAPEALSGLKTMYAAMLKEFMLRMKGNYQQLQQGSKVAGAYVEFAQKIVQFLKQYTNDICPVVPFFTDSVGFPLPAHDPTYVVGRLCGYAPKARDLGNAKQLSVFIETVAQQAAADGQQPYLVEQLTSALCSHETPGNDRTSLRATLLQGIFPVYIEAALTSNIGFHIGRPILQSLQSILETTIFDLRAMDEAHAATAVESVVAISNAYIRGVRHLKSDMDKFKQPHVMCSLRYMMGAMTCCFTLLEYICARTMTRCHFSNLPVVTHVQELCAYITALISDDIPSHVPSYTGATTSAQGMIASLSQFCKKGLEESIETNWEESAGTIRFGRGPAQRDVNVEMWDVDQERILLFAAILAFKETLWSLKGDDGVDTPVWSSALDDDVFV